MIRSMKLKTNEKSGNSTDRQEENEQVKPDPMTEMKNEIERKLDQVVIPQGPGHSIFEVPSSLQKLQPDEFIPHLVSIGPYHRNQKHLQGMEKQKWRILRHVLDKTGRSLDCFTNAMFKLEPKTRKCYDKPFENFSRQEFVEMMLLDACFILELLIVAIKGITNCGYNLDDPLFAKWGLSPYIQRDLLMLENQLPLFVLNRLFPLVAHRQSLVDFVQFFLGNTVVGLTLEFFDSILPGLSQNLSKLRSREQTRLHLLDVVLQALCPSSISNCDDRHLQLNVLDLALPRSSKSTSSQANGEEKQPRQHVLDLSLPPFSRCTSSQANCADKQLQFDVIDIPLPPFSRYTSSQTNPENKQPVQTAVLHSVTCLRGASVKFRKKDSTNFTDIEFNQGALNIPPFVIHNFTKSIFLNLMVFEQYYPQCSTNYVTSYVHFIDGLINSAKDVEYLCDKRIIVHRLGSNDNVAILFDNLRRYILSDTNDSNLAKVSQDLNEHLSKYVNPEVTLLGFDKKPGFEVPIRIQELQPEAFIPHVVSIGPYHRNETRLLKMEKHKQRLRQDVLHRTAYSLDYLMGALFDLEVITRNFYDKPFKSFSSREFVEMMLLDACFILELLNVTDKEITDCYNSKDPLFTRRGILSFIKRDLLMLENQLPLFVIKRLFCLTRSKSMKRSLDQLSLQFFDSILPNLSENPPGDPQNCFHLLDLVRQALRPSSNCKDGQHHATRSTQVNSEEKQPFQTAMHSVTRLRGIDVEFRTKDSTKFTNIEFNEGVLFIPPLVIHGSTKSIFLNLMVFEQHYPQCDNYITSYVSFMDGLINSAKDVEYLYKKKIIYHDLGTDEDVASLFNNLRKEIVTLNHDSYLAEVSDNLNRNFNEKWRTRRATLKHEHLKDPWKVISLIAASFLIVFALLQTTYTMLGYHHPHP
ncbi:hypothetical protein F0562_025051 [Nyssa sinensis]|uniref:Uncharacterized protein n=1 Tax=Nyssa sinensis TaxID=561372 RepID=A0A5J5BEP5_9ASTE|nr:hypothetical protein F0562_025051 [Nyssa sinensis]